SHIGIPGKGLVNLLLVATMNNVVFAFDADGPKPGTDGVLWKRNLGTPPSIDDVLKNFSIDQPCIDPGGYFCENPGIMSTRCIDPGGHHLGTHAVTRHPSICPPAARYSWWREFSCHPGGLRIDFTHWMS